MNTRTGHVILVGAGPGDPGLITVKGLAVLRRADVVVYDRLVAPELVAKAPRRAKRIYVGKEPGKTQQQERINRLLIREARHGRRVVRLKGGDPFVFGRGGEEMLALTRVGIRCDIIPGVTSAFAVPAAAGIPVTHRGLAASVSVFTGHEDPHKRTPSRDWLHAARGRGTLIFLMGVDELPRLVRDLVHAGRPATTPCAVIEWGTTPRQRTIDGTLATIVRATRTARIGPPAIFIAGDVVSLRSGRGPLDGLRVLVTRPRERAQAFAEMLTKRGAEVASVPAIALQPLPSSPRLRRTLHRLREYDWVLFTSPTGVEQWVARCLQANGARRDLQQLRVGAIGPKTAAAARAHGLRVTCLPQTFQQEGLLRALRRYRWQGQRVLLPRAQEARTVLPDTLTRWGAEVDVLPLYAARPAPGARAQLARVLRGQPVDVVTFTSSQCVEQFLRAITPSQQRQLFRRAVVASIGPITSATLKQHGLRVDIQPRESTTAGLTTAIERWAQTRHGRR